MSTSSGSRPHYASTSLYVGDLLPEVSEAVLYEFFNSIGDVASIKVCRDLGSRRSLRYAYVNYHSVADAERALESLNYTPIKGHPCRIMWSQRDATVRKTNQGNLFIKNLDKSVDNRALHDTFSLFGNILSCKVVTDELGKSKGYGFLHFETDEAAAAAIEKVNGMQIGSKEVYVGYHQKRSERSSGQSENFTNLYTRNFPSQWTEETLRSVFSPYGTITSIFLSADHKGRPFACVNYEEAADAKRALAELNGKAVGVNGLNEVIVDEEPRDENNTHANKSDNQSTADARDESLDKRVDQGDGSELGETVEDNPPQMILFVDRARDKKERSQMSKGAQLPIGATRKLEGVNLYIKNLSERVTDEALREMFEPFGIVTSARVMRDEDGHSKGFAFVCFSVAEEAARAIAEMHCKVCDGHPLYVGLAEHKDRRHARLQNHFRGGRPVNRKEPMYEFGNFSTTQGKRLMGTKQLIGEKLFPLVYAHQPELAGKITGMMLDMDEAELTTLIHSELELEVKINEALRVLQNAAQYK